MASFPLIRRISEECLKLDAFQAAHPSNQPDCPQELKWISTVATDTFFLSKRSHGIRICTLVLFFCYLAEIWLRPQELKWISADHCAVSNVKVLQNSEIMFSGIKCQQTCFFIISVDHVFWAFNSIFLHIINVQSGTVVSDVHFLSFYCIKSDILHTSH